MNRPSLPRAVSRRLAAIPIRWRLGLVSAGLTFAILLAFALVIGAFTADRLRSDFDRELREVANDLQNRIEVDCAVLGECRVDERDVVQVGGTGDAAVRIVYLDGTTYGSSAPLGPPSPGVTEVEGYRVVSEPLRAPDALTAAAYLQYARPDDGLEATIARVNSFLGLGVLGGTALALLAGLAVARRAMHPIADLTNASKAIARTGDPAGRMPEPKAEDEVADLARTLEEMLRSLDAARRETEATLGREREFVADASHELRTPLTSVLANLELLEAALEGEDREIAGSALRSTQRMRRLVGDLLFLARSDAGTSAPATLVPTDLGKVARDVVAETAPLVTSHEVSLDAREQVVVESSPDDLHRLVLNLVQNAVAHTPPGTRVLASVHRADGDARAAVLEVTDDGPGVAPDVRARAFERFVRGGGDGTGARGAGGRGSGLGLAIVQAVADAHGGTVELDDAPGGGARFTVRLPLAGAGDAPPGPQTSTTTGSTSGLRLKRS